MGKIIPYGRQHITREDLDAVQEVLQSDFLTQGPEIETFEQRFSAYVSAPHALAVSNGTAALHLCAMAMDIQPGDKVITSPITFAASANCVRYMGGEVCFADIDPETYLLDPNAVAQLLEKHPPGTFKGIIPVDLTGYPCDLEAFRNLADQHNLWIIEDACHAPGAWFTDSKGQKQQSGNGNYADLAIFSFHPVKHIACGEGGMITGMNLDLHKRMARLRTHGITKEADLLEENHGGWYYEMHELGYNYRLTDMQAALGTSQLKRAAAGLARRREIAQRYIAAFEQNENIDFQKFDSSLVGHAYHLFVIQVADRKGLYDHLREQSIFAQVHYIPLHYLPYYKNQGWQKGDFPHAEAYYDSCLSLPMYPTLTDEEQDFVIEKVLSYV